MTGGCSSTTSSSWKKSIRQSYRHYGIFARIVPEDSRLNSIYIHYWYGQDSCKYFDKCEIYVSYV